MTSDLTPSLVRVAHVLAQHLAAANLLGRLQVTQLVQKRTGRAAPIATSSRIHFADAPGVVDPGTLDLSAGFSLDLPPTRGVEYLRNLVPVSRDVFDGLTAQYQRLAFTIAGTSDVQLVEKIRNALSEVAAKGGTSADFRALAHELTTEAGVEDLSAFTLDTVFNTNMQKAYALGRFEQMTEPTVREVLPYWQYWTVHDGRVRPEHRVLHSFTARSDDPVWNKIYPPNGFNCRCSVVPILANEAPEGADTPGMERLPALAMALVPQAGFHKVFA